MAFTQLPTNYAVAYSQELANAYPYLMYFGEIYSTPNNSLYQPSLTNARTVEIPSMTVKGAHAVDRDNMNGSFTRNFNASYESKTMSMYREWDTLVDQKDIDETNLVYSIAKITQTFNQFQKLPEMDSYASSTLATAATYFGNVDGTALTKDTILEAWDTYNAGLTDARIPLAGRVAYLTPAYYKLLKQAAGITRFLTIGSNNDGGINREIGSLDGVTIKQVPSDMMYSAYDFAEGAVKSAGASQINMLIVHPLSLIAPVVYETSMITPPSANTRGKWLYYESFYYDIFTLNQRLTGLYANIGSPSLLVLTVTSVAGSSSGKSTISVAEVLKPGMKYVYKVAAGATAVAYGDALTAGWAELGTGVDITLTTGQVITVAEVNTSNGKAVGEGHIAIVSKA